MTPPDDLAAILRFVWDELTRAASDGESRFRHAQLSTIGTDGAPQSRSVILRHADESARVTGFHTDARSTKIGELGRVPRVALLAYDRPRGLQIRVWGAASLHRGDTRARAAWDALYPPLRTPYRNRFAPGTALDDPASADPTAEAREPADPDQGFETFAFVPIRADGLEFLRLSRDGHRRARFEWRDGWQGRWLAP